MSKGMNDIKEDIKNGSYSPVYLIYGEEAYLRENFRNSLIKALVKPGDNLNYTRFAGGSINPAEIVSLAITLPFMAEKRVILVSESGFFKKTPDEIADYLSEPSPDTVLIFLENEVDKRSRGFLTAKKEGYDVKAEKFDDKKLVTWIAADFKRFNKKVTRETIEALMDRVGTDMNALDMEIRKLASYVGDRDVVTSDDVAVLVHRNPASTIFMMMDAIGSKQLGRAIACYYDMKAQKESAFAILSHIERHFRQMIAVNEMTQEQREDEVYLKGLGIQKFMVGKYLKQARKFSRNKMISVLEACAKADREIKLGEIDKDIAVELVIIGVASS